VDIPTITYSPSTIQAVIKSEPMLVNTISVIEKVDFSLASLVPIFV